MNTAKLSLQRRQFLKASAGALTLVVGLDAMGQAQEPQKFGAATMPGGTVDDPLVFISLATDGTVTIVAHRAEMGAGIRTSLPMVVADELEARWEKVKITQAPAGEKRYGNQNTDGSRSMRHFFEPMRRAGGAMRYMLESAAAARWAVPLSEVQGVQHEVVHKPTGRRISYGDLALDAARQPVPAGASLQLKSPAQWQYIGKGRVGGYDMQDITRGKATYGMDMVLQGMVFAVVARPPVVGGKLRSLDSSEALKVAGVLRIVEIPAFTGAPMFQPLGGVAVVAVNTWAAMQGRAALKMEWDDGPNASYDSKAFRKTQEALVRKPGTPYRNDGDAPKAIADAPQNRRFSAEYFVPHLTHATMEPPVATAVVTASGCEVWTSTQNPQAALDSVAATLGFKPEQVTVNTLLLGGGFGRKSKPDYVCEAAWVAKAMAGTPVKLVWTRDDDIHHSYYHAVSLDRLEAAVDETGLPTAWLHRTAAPTITSTFAPGAKAAAPFEAGMSASNMPFQIPHVRIERGEVSAHARIGWFRSVANIPHVFAIQSFVDELAHRAGRDPLEFARALIGPPRKINPTQLSDTFNYSESPDIYPVDTGRMRAVLDAAARGARWGRKLPKGHGLGLAFAYSFVSYTATVVEVAVDAKGQVRVVAVDMAIDCGPQINPERIRSQMEGAVVMGLSLALTSQITFEAGRVQQSNFHDYEVLRQPQSPRTIRTHLVGGDVGLPLGGVGEPPMPPVAPALVNAIYAATKRRVRSLPIGGALV
jgi:isoquinoline 1-oxidoreductase beta subunit